MEFNIDDKEGIKKILEQRVQETLASKNYAKKPNNDNSTSDTINNSSITNYILFGIVLFLATVISFYVGTTTSKTSQTNVATPTTDNASVTVEQYNQNTQELLTTIADLKELLKTKEAEATKKVTQTKEVVTKTEVAKTISQTAKPIVPVIETISENTNTDYEPISSTDEFNLFKCYEAKVGSFMVPDRCLENIPQFLNENKSASKFEIIGVVNDDDKIYLKSFFKETATANMIEFASMGLSRHRVVEASWKAKEIIGEDINLTPVNYTINSKISRGFVIRAYK